MKRRDWSALVSILTALFLLSFCIGCGGGSSTPNPTPTPTPPSQAVISISATTVAFGDQRLNATSAEQSITISNTGNATLVVSGITLSGAHASEFALVNVATPLSISAGSSARVSVTARPGSEGARSATLAFTSNASNSAPTVALSANGVAPHVSASVPSINFGDQLVNTTSSQQAITITNSGTATLTISSVAISGGDSSAFQVSSGGGSSTVAPGKTVNITVTASPAHEGAHSSTLVITSDAITPLPALTLSVNGTIAHIVANPTTITFADQLPNTTSPSTPLVILNSGATGFALISITITGASASEFAFTGPTLPMTLAPQSSTQLAVTFTPVAAGMRAAAVELGYQGGTLTIPVSGKTKIPTQDPRASVSFSPETAARGDTVTVNVTGDLTYFLQGATMADFGPGISAGGASGPQPIDVTGQTAGSIQLLIGPESAPGARIARVWTGDHSSAATFFITPATSEPDQLPVSNSGPEQQAGVGSGVHVDASRSYIRMTPGDPDLGFKWSFLSVPTGSSAALSDEGDMFPAFTPDQPGNYVLQLSATTGAQTTSSSVVVSTSGTSPVAEAGPNQAATVGGKVRLDGSGSISPDGSSLTYHWDLVSKPDASTTSLTNPDSVYPVFIVDTAGTYVARLLVGDGKGNQSADKVTVSTINQAPLANPGSPQGASVGTQVQLDGTASSDPDGDDLTYNWTMIHKPSGSTAAFADATVAKPTFTVDIAGTYLVQLIVTDKSGNSSDPATVAVSTNPMPPVAVAGKQKSVVIGSNVNLDGSASSDSGHHILNYKWTLLNKPDGSAAALVGANTAKPSFTADTAGFYVAQLIVSYGTFKSVPATVLVIADTAALTVDQNKIDFGTINLGSTSDSKILKITSSGTADLVISSYTISGNGAPDFAFTSATLPITLSSGDSTTVSLTFKPTMPGPRTATMVINSNGQNNPLTVDLVGSGASPIFSIDNTSLAFGEQVVSKTASKTVTISNTGGAELDLTSLQISGANAAEYVVTPNTTPIKLAPGANTVLTVNFTPAASGARSATLTIDHNAQNHPAVVTLTGTGVAPVSNVTPTTLTFDSQVVNTTSLPQTLNVKNAGTGTLAISAITISGDNADEFAASATLPLNIAQNASATIPVTFSPKIAGQRIATISFTDNSTGTAQTVALTGTATSNGTLKFGAPLSVGQNLESSVVTVSLVFAATENISVEVSSADPSQMLVSLDPTKAGSASVTVSIAQGAMFAVPGFYVQALGSSGTVQLIAKATGYSQATTAVSLYPSAFVLAGGSGIGQDFTTGLKSDTQLRITAYELNPDLTMQAEQKVRGGMSLTIPVSSSATSVGTIAGSPATITGGSSYSDTVSFHPVTAGDTTLSLAQPAGFSQPKTGSQLKATVTGPAITLKPLQVGSNLEINGLGTVDVAPSSDLHVTVQSSDTNTLLLTLDPTQAGSAAIDLLLPAGQTILPTFYIQAVSSSGTAQITASASGYTSGTAAVTITPSGIVIANHDGMNGGAFTTTTISPNYGLYLLVYRLDSQLRPVATGMLRGGLPLNVTVTSSDSTIGTMVGSPATFMGGDSSNSVSFHSVGAGTATIAVQQPAGFSTPAGAGSLTATVTSPAIFLTASNNNIGKDLQVKGLGSLNVGAPSGGLTVTISSDNPMVLVSSSETTVGAASITLLVPAGKGNLGVGFPAFYIQAKDATGTATITAQASGWTSGSLVVTMTPSGFVLQSPNGIGADMGVLLSQGNKTLTVLSAQLDPATLNIASLEEVRGLASPLPVNLVSSDPTVGTIDLNVTFTGGTSKQTATFRPLKVGTTILSITTPPGFSQPAFGAQLNAVVN